MLRIRDVYPGSRILIFTLPESRIPDPKTAIKIRSEKKFVVIPFFWSHKFHKIELFYFWNVEEKNLGHFQRIIELFTQKIVTKLSKIWVWDPRTGTRDPEKPIPDPGSRGQKGTGSRIRNTSNNWTSVCGSKVFIPDHGSDFFQPESRIWGPKGNGSRIRIRNIVLKWFKPQKLLLCSWKYDPGCLFRIPNPEFLDVGSRGRKSIGSRIRIRNTEFNKFFVKQIGPYGIAIVHLIVLARYGIEVVCNSSSTFSENIAFFGKQI